MMPAIIVCGLAETGYKIFSLLRQQGTLVVGINDQPLESDEPYVVVGDLRSAATLIKAGIKHAQTLVLANNDDALNLAILVQARVLNPDIRIINRLFNTGLGDRLDQTLPDHTTMSVSLLAAPVFTFAALGNRAIGQLQLFKQTWPMHEEKIHPDHPWRGRKLSDLWDDRSRMLIYYMPANDSTNLVSAVCQEQALQPGDRLIIATKPNMRQVQQSLLQRFVRFLRGLRRVHQHGRSAIAVILSLLLTIFLATLTYTAINLNVSPIDALYFSVGMITGAGGNEKVVENAPDSIKVFTVIMMIVGAGVVGVCYALLNDYVLGTRFKQLWTAVYVPSNNHYVVCGLGGLGIQIARQLRSQGHDVVVIERDQHCRFANTAQALKIPIIYGDATLTSVLESAHIHRAEALVAVTSHNTANLEIALTAKGLVPKLPVVVRNQDPQFSFMAQQVFEFEAVLSPTELAAPSFAAAALGGRIFGNGMMAGTLWVALATLITPNHPFCSRQVKDLAITSDFVPLYLEHERQSVHGWSLLETTLAPNDVLHLTLPANRLDQLWRASSKKQFMVNT